MAKLAKKCRHERESSSDEECSQMNRIIGKCWANNHDFERVNVKHSPSDGEDVEMSAILKEQNGVDDLEGQQTSFKRTDATLAWAKKCPVMIH